MNKPPRSIPILLALSLVPALAAAQETAPPAPAIPQEEAPVDAHADDPTAVLGFTMRDIHGEERPLEEHRGSVVLMVNVASACGLTPQYEGLEALYQKYKDRGLVILGFPANNFGGQEPGTEAEILEFCTGKYQVTFPMYSKISVIGEDRHPLYAKLAGATAEQGGEPTWNFTKYLVDRSGHVVTRFDPRTKPGDERVIAEIERLLEEPAPEKPAAETPGDTQKKPD